MSMSPEAWFQNGNDPGSGIGIAKKICVAAKRNGLKLKLHLDPVQGPAGCRPREVSPLPSAAAHLIFPGILQKRLDIPGWQHLLVQHPYYQHPVQFSEIENHIPT